MLTSTSSGVFCAPFILGSGCFLDYFDVNLIFFHGSLFFFLESRELLLCVLCFWESLCWQLLLSALVTAFMVSSFLPERSDLNSLKCLWSFDFPLIAGIA